MIIECPKCKTKFEVKDNLLKNEGMKFQCSECAFIWNENLGSNKNIEVSNTFKDEKNEKLPSILVEDEAEIVKDSKKFMPSLFSVKNLIIFLMAVVLFTIILLLGKFVMDSSSKTTEGQNIFEYSDKNKKAKDLYIEIIKPLSLTKEGSNEYIIIRGFVYNPTNTKMRVPKLVIRLENTDERVLQEQEREIEKKTLAPLEKTDFMFKVFKFSSQVARVKVDFVDETKI